MDTAAIRKEIEEMIKEKVRDIGRPDLYREPMVGFVSVDDPSIVNVKDIVGPWHDSPDDQLPGARTIIAYTVPFTREVAMDPGNAEFSGLTWSEAYVIINKNFELISKAVADYLRSKGYEAATVTSLGEVFKGNTTIKKKIEYLTWFLRWARDVGYPVNPAFKAFKPTLKQTQNKVIYLTKEELAQIRDLDLSAAPRLEPIRDIFLFCCLTSLRHSDADNLRKTDVKGDHIEVTTIKTGDSVSIKLNKTAQAILEKYKDIPLTGNRALPSYTNQAMNRSIKDLCQLAGINELIRITTYKGNVRKDEVHPKWELVGTHTGRRTFIVHALSMGISPSVVMKWTGHSDYKAMKPYIDIVDSAKDEAMAKFDNLL